MFCCLVSSQPEAALAVAQSCSPRVARVGDVVVFDASGCSRAIGPLETIAGEVMTLLNRHGAQGTTLAIGPTVTMAWLLAHARPGPTVVAPGAEATALAKIPLGWLGTLLNAWHLESGAPQRSGVDLLRRAFQDRLAILERWGLGTLGDLAGLARADVHARLGAVGVRMHQAACGEDVAPFVPMEEAPRFVDRMVLEWPIDGLEPLAFVLARQCERLSAALEQADRGATVISTRLRLVTHETHERVLHLPTPMRDARVLRTLILLDLESHPPSAAIDIVELDLDVTPGRIVQGSLLAASVPTPEALATLLARLTALMGESRVGSPQLLDTYDERAVGMAGFDMSYKGKGQRAEGKGKGTGEREKGRGEGKGQRVEDRGQRADDQVSSSLPSVLFPSSLSFALCPLPFALRRFRIPVAAEVVVERGAPVRMVPSARGLAGGRVVERAGPCRSSGGWWTFDRGWDRDTWDLQVADGSVYRVARNRTNGQWVIEGVLD
jgi:protein ImuB